MHEKALFGHVKDGNRGFSRRVLSILGVFTVVAADDLARKDVHLRGTAYLFLRLATMFLMPTTVRSTCGNS